MNKLTPEEFRRRLAGIEDIQESGAYSPDLYRDSASDFICALAIAFNRKLLKPMTLWSRISSAIETGVVAARGGDIERFEEHCLRHVKASTALVVASDDYRKLTAAIRNYDDANRVHFVRALAEHSTPWLILGRDRWETRKAELQAARAELAEMENEVEE